MNPTELGTKYDKIAQWWHERHHDSAYGVQQFQRAIAMSAKGGKALDVGCGVGGRFVRILEEHEFSVTVLDVSIEMVNLARENHPQYHFIHQDICTWETSERLMTHFPTARLVLNKMCSCCWRRAQHCIIWSWINIRRTMSTIHRPTEVKQIL